MRGQHFAVLDDRHVGIAAGEVHRAQIGAHPRVVRLAAEVMLVGGDRLVVTAAVIVDIADAVQRLEIVGSSFST